MRFPHERSQKPTRKSRKATTDTEISSRPKPPFRRPFCISTVSHKTVDEMASMYGFNQEQKDYLAELLKDENNQLWSQVLYGIGYSDGQIVTVALSQVGNVGGQPYWS